MFRRAGFCCRHHIKLCCGRTTGGNPMPAVYFVVRAIVSDASKRAAFDRWYETEHVPDAVKAFGIAKAWRFWSLDDPSLHQAMYQFDDEAKLHAMLQGDE